MARAKSSKTTKTLVSQQDYILLDRSGSMAARWSDTLGGVNAYVHGLAKDKATAGILVTVQVFDTHSIDVVRRSVVASAWKDIMDSEVSPRGGTPLYDAVGRLVTLADGDAPEKSAIVVMTDGQENASHEHTKASAKGLLDRCRAKGWQVIFLGADFDNMSQGMDLGNAAGATMSFSSAAAPVAMAATARMRASYSAAGEPMLYSKEDRTQAAGGSGSPKAPARTA